MKNIMGHGFYELDYGKERYENLEFIRMDTICGVNYFTLKNALTEEIMTFEKEKITWVRKQTILPALKRAARNMVADRALQSI